ncbi:MAG: TonB-dependent receptor [Acidobacteria bacterium]|nr:TonB-dependent receptor [Acidobacteriota bacterium]
MIKIPKTTALGLLLGVFLLVWQTPAQTATAALSVFVTDEQNAAVPNAVLKIKNEQTAFERTATTGSDGGFVFTQLPPSGYVLSVEAKGFAVSRAGIVLNVNDQSSLHIQLKVSAVGATVEVAADQLVTDSPAVSTVVDRQFIENQPLNGRSFQNLVELSPGVVISPSNLVNPGQFSVNGQRTSSNYLTVDGVSGNFGSVAATTPYESLGGTVPSYSVLGTTASLASVDAVQEFSIQTSTYAPEFGRQPGGQISLVTKSGTNRFSGSVFDYLRNDKLDANNWFANANNLKRQPLRQNDFGGVLGGPLLIPRVYDGRNRTFFFFSYEGLRLRYPFVSEPLEVPSMAARANATGVMREILNAFPRPTGVVSATNPNVAAYIANFTNPARLDATSFRIDHQFTGKLGIFGRYNYSPSQDDQRARFCATSCVGRLTSKTQTLTLGTTILLSSSISNDLRFNVSKSKSNQTYFIDTFGGAVIPSPSALYPSFTDGSRGYIYIEANTSGSNTLSDGLFSDFRQRQLNLVETLNWTAGNHSLKFGFDYRRLFPATFSGYYKRQFLPDSIAALVANTPSAAAIIAPQLALYPIYDNYSAFAQDTWRATPALTLTYGVRYEVVPPPSEKNGNLPPTVTDLSNPAAVTLAPAGTKFYKTTYNNFAPRAGVAYQLPKFGAVVRGGFGVFYDLGYNFSGTAFSTGAYPFASITNLTNQTYTSPTFAVPAPPVNPNPPYSRIFAYGSDHKLPYTLQFNVAVEKSFNGRNTVSLSYIGARGRRLGRVESLRAVNANFPRIDLSTNGGFSNYDALQAQYQRRLSNGLQALASYTFGKSLDNVSEEANNNYQAPTGRFDVRSDYGASGFDIRHSFNAALSYEIPAPFKSGLGRRIFGGFGLDAIFRARTATPVNVVSGVNRFNLGTTTVLRPDYISGQPLYIDDPNAAGGRRFNPAAFVVPPATENRQGTFGRNVLRGFGAQQVDLSLRRTFALAERVNLQLRADGFNILNHANFANPGGVVTSSTFGRAVQMLGNGLGGLSALYQIGGPRSFQLSAKLNF